MEESDDPDNSCEDCWESRQESFHESDYWAESLDDEKEDTNASDIPDEPNNSQKMIYNELFKRYEKHKRLMSSHSNKLETQIIYSMLQNNSQSISNMIDSVDSSDSMKLPIVRSTDEIAMIKYEAETPIPANYKIQITYVDIEDEYSFFFHFEDQLKIINKINCEMLKISNKSQLEISESDIKKNLYCSAFYQHFWYRSRVMDVSGELIKVFLIDYGDIVEVSLMCLRYLLKDFASIPRQANKCILMDSYPLDVVDLQYLFEAKFYRLIDNVFFIKLIARCQQNEQNIKQMLLDHASGEYDEIW